MAPSRRGGFLTKICFISRLTKSPAFANDRGNKRVRAILP